MKLWWGTDSSWRGSRNLASKTVNMSSLSDRAGCLGGIFRSLIQWGESGGESSFVLRFSDKQFNLSSSFSDLGSGEKIPHRLLGALSHPGGSVTSAHAAQVYPEPSLRVLSCGPRFRVERRWDSEQVRLCTLKLPTEEQAGWPAPRQHQVFCCNRTETTQNVLPQVCHRWCSSPRDPPHLRILKVRAGRDLRNNESNYKLRPFTGWAPPPDTTRRSGLKTFECFAKM